MHIDVLFVCTLLMSHFQSNRIKLHRGSSYRVGTEEFAYWDSNGFHECTAEDNAVILGALYHDGNPKITIGGFKVDGLNSLRTSNYGAMIIWKDLGGPNALVRKDATKFQYFSRSSFKDLRPDDSIKMLHARALNSRCVIDSDLVINRDAPEDRKNYATGWQMVRSGNGAFVANVIRKPTGMFQRSHLGSVFADLHPVQSAIIANTVEAEKFDDVQMVYNGIRVTVEGLLWRNPSGMHFATAIGDVVVRRKPVPRFTVRYGVRNDQWVPHSDEVQQIVRAAVYAGDDTAYFRIGQGRYKIEGLSVLGKHLIVVGESDSYVLFETNLSSGQMRELRFDFPTVLNTFTELSYLYTIPQLAEKILDLNRSGYVYSDLGVNVFYTPPEQSVRMGQQPSGQMISREVVDKHYLVADKHYLAADFTFPEGIDANERRYSTRYQTVYFTNTGSGHLLLALFTEAFQQGVLFKLGNSQTEANKYWATFGDIPLKTALRGYFGYLKDGGEFDVSGYRQYLIDALSALELNGVTLDDLHEPVKQKIFGPQRP